MSRASEQPHPSSSRQRSDGSSHSERRRVILRLALYPAGFYLIVTIMIASLQRKLTYFPFPGPISTDDAGLPAGTVHDIETTTDDGLVLHGWHVLAESRTADDRHECQRELERGRPLVLFFAGNAANRRYRIAEIEPLRRAGADVFIFDYRGYGDNEGSPSEEALAADARAIWEYTVEQRDVRPERIILYGESLGGAVAVRLAAEVSERGTPPGGLILRSTFSSLADTAAHHYWWLPVRWLMVEEYASCRRIGSVTCPVLFLHGTRDEIIPLKLGRKLFEAAPQRSAGGIPVRFVELEGADHNRVLSTHDREIGQAVASFIGELRQKRGLPPEHPRYFK